MRKIIMYHADWCGPCKYDRAHYVPAVEELAGGAHIEQVNVRDAYTACRRLHIARVPAYVLVDDDGAEHVLREKLPPEVAADYLAGKGGCDVYSQYYGQ